MASSGEEVRVPIGIPVETNASEAADQVGELRDQLARSKDVIRDATNHLKGLRGGSDAVKAAKDQLKAVIEKERQAVSDTTLRLIKQGSSLDTLASKARIATKATTDITKKQGDLKKATAGAITKTNEERAKAFAGALGQVGGPAKALSDRLKSLRDFAANAAGSGGLGLTTLAVAGLAAACVATAIAVTALIAKLSHWALRGADAARSMQLLRQATTSTTSNAISLGTQVDALAKKVPTSTSALNELAASLARSRLGGQQTVDLLNAMSQASAALGDDTAANKMRELVERGRLTQRMYLGLFELQGSGLDFEDVQDALASSMKISVEKSRKALLAGEVPLGEGAKALRLAAEKKFGVINLKKMMSLEGLADTASKLLSSLTKDIDLEPAAQSVFKLLHAFDETTATGAVLKRMVTVFGQSMAGAIEKGAPIVREFLRGMIIGGLEVYIGYLRVKKALREAFGGTDLLQNIDVLNVALESGKFLVTSFAIGVGAVTVAVVAFGAALAAPIVAFQKLQNVGIEFGTMLRTMDWKATGLAIVDGLVDGITSGATKLGSAIKGLGDKVKSAFKSALGIKSPSKVFEQFGKQTTAGYKKGVEKSSPEAEGAVKGMAAPPPMPAPRSAFGGAGGGEGARAVQATFEITIVMQGGPGAPAPAQQAQDPGLLAALTKTLKEAAAAAGIPTPEAA